jgi:putative glutamine amidotransferase
MKPIIAITTEPYHDPADARTGGKIELNWNYAQAVADAGGVPLIVPPMADMDAIAKLIDGWLIPGGLDIDACNFGQDNHPKSELQDPARFNGEKALYEKLPDSIPVLGICYGCQFINVVRGGDLIQHLPDLEGATTHTGGVLQDYVVDSDSKLSGVFGTDSVKGKSYHHQAVDRPGKNLKVVGRNEDGTVEALEATDRPWLIGVQWHPERTLEDPASQRLFKSFIEAARSYADSKVSPVTA